MLVTFDEKMRPLPVPVRVGQAVDVVGQAGKPKTITGFQTHTTPVLLSQGERAELATEGKFTFDIIEEDFTKWIFYFRISTFNTNHGRICNPKEKSRLLVLYHLCMNNKFCFWSMLHAFNLILMHFVCADNLGNNGCLEAFRNFVSEPLAHLHSINEISCLDALV